MDDYYSGKKEVPFSGSSYNVYCDESCHLEHDKSKAMSLGAIWCPKNKVREMSKRLIEVKGKHGIPKDAEVKWTKISPCNLPLYIDIIDYFFDDDDLSFRGLIVPDKTILRHSDFDQYQMAESLYRTLPRLRKARYRPRRMHWGYRLEIDA